MGGFPMSATKAQAVREAGTDSLPGSYDLGAQTLGALMEPAAGRPGPVTGKSSIQRGLPRCQTVKYLLSDLSSITYGGVKPVRNTSETAKLAPDIVLLDCGTQNEMVRGLVVHRSGVC